MVSHSSQITQQIRVAPKITRTSPLWMAPDTIWSQKASMVPPVMTTSLSGSCLPPRPSGTTIGICFSAMPMEPRRSVFQPLCVWSIPSEAVTPVSMAGSPEMALVATAWQGQ